MGVGKSPSHRGRGPATRLLCDWRLTPWLTPLGGWEVGEQGGPPSAQSPVRLLALLVSHEQRALPPSQLRAGWKCRPSDATAGRVQPCRAGSRRFRNLGNSLENHHTHTHKRLLGSPLSTLWGGVGQAAADRKPRGAATHFGVDSVSHDCLHGWGRTTTGSTAFRRHRLRCRPLSRAATAPLPQRGEGASGGADQGRALPRGLGWA